MDRNRHMATRTANLRDNVTEVTDSAQYVTAPLPALAVAALERLERAFATNTTTKQVA